MLVSVKVVSGWLVPPSLQFFIIQILKYLYLSICLTSTLPDHIQVLNDSVEYKIVKVGRASVFKEKKISLNTYIATFSSTDSYWNMQLA